MLALEPQKHHTYTQKGRGGSTVQQTSIFEFINSIQEYWNGLPFPFPGDLPDPGTELMSSALAGGFFTTEPSQKPLINPILLCS